MVGASETPTLSEHHWAFATYRRNHPLKKSTVSSYRINHLITADHAWMSPFWILVLLRMTEVEATTGATRRAKLRSNCHHQQTKTQLYTLQMPFMSPNQQCQSTEEEKYHIPQPFYPHNVYVSAVFATAMWLAGWLGVCLSHAGIVSKRLNLS